MNDAEKRVSDGVEMLRPDGREIDKTDTAIIAAVDHADTV